MVFQPVPDTMGVKMRYTQNLQQVENTLYFRAAEGWSAELMDTFLSQLYNVWFDVFKPIQSNSLTLREIVGVQLESEVDITRTYTPATTQNGAVPDPPLPNSVTLAVSFRTGLTGRSARGRNYWLGLCENQVVQNAVIPAVTEDILTAYAAVLDLANDFPCQWVVVQRYSNGTKLPTAITRPIVDVTIVNDVVDSQRRRLPGRGI